jgi:hypothetical protein
MIDWGLDKIEKPLLLRSYNLVVYYIHFFSVIN